MRPAGQLKAQRAGRDELDGKWLFWIGGILVFGKLIRPDRGDKGKVVVERVPDAILCALADNFPGMGGRLKFRNLVGEIIEILQRAEIAADVHGIVEQRRRGRNGGRGGKAEQAGGGNAFDFNHGGAKDVLMTILCSSLAGAAVFVMSSK